MHLPDMVVYRSQIPSLYGSTGRGGLILHRLEAGTHNLLGIIGLSLALDDLTVEGRAKIHRREMEPARRLYMEFKKIPGLQLYGLSGNDRHVALFSANIDGMYADDFKAILDGDCTIAARSGLPFCPYSQVLTNLAAIN
jgi:cysteine desulfurase / selenocysteine lyase